MSNLAGLPFRKVVGMRGGNRTGGFDIRLETIRIESISRGIVSQIQFDTIAPHGAWYGMRGRAVKVRASGMNLLPDKRITGVGRFFYCQFTQMNSVFTQLWSLLWMTGFTVFRGARKKTGHSDPGEPSWIYPAGPVSGARRGCKTGWLHRILPG